MTQDEFDQFLASEAGVPYIPRAITEMKEAKLSSEVRKLIDKRPELWGHSSYDFQHRTGAGWVDWVIMGRGGVLFRELKSSNGTLTELQRWVGNTMRRHGHDWAVWRPEQLHDGTIERQLDALTVAP